MGLTVHYSFESEINSVKAIKDLIGKIRQRAMDLPFHSVTDMFDLKGDECDIDKQRHIEDGGRRWMLCGVSAHVTIQKTATSELSTTVPPKRLIGFTVLVGAGSEPLNFVFATYPKTIRYPQLKSFPWETKTYRVGRPQWSGYGFCKTQYASDPECGGVENFLRCHISVITLLEYAQSLPGLKLTINDEGKYGTSNYTDDWTVPKPVYYLHDATHDAKALVEEIGEWNEMIAAFSGTLKDTIAAAGGNPQELESAIDSFPDREHLEAKGVEKRPELRTNLGLK